MKKVIFVRLVHAEAVSVLSVMFSTLLVLLLLYGALYKEEVLVNPRRVRECAMKPTPKKKKKERRFRLAAKQQTVPETSR